MIRVKKLQKRKEGRKAVSGGGGPAKGWADPFVRLLLKWRILIPSVATNAKATGKDGARVRETEEEMEEQHPEEMRRRRGGRELGSECRRLEVGEQQS